MMKKITIIAMFMLLGSLGILPGVSDQKVYADACKGQINLLGIPPWYDGLCKPDTSEVEITDPAANITRIILNVIGIAIRLAGYAAIGFVIWGGIKYMLASGDSSKIASAKKTITNALIGLLIALSAVAIVGFIAGGFS